MTTFIEVPSEIGAGTRGASLGINALKAISQKRKDAVFTDRITVCIPQVNHILFKESDTPWALNIEHYHKIFEAERQQIAKALETEEHLLILSGDHANAAGILAGIRQNNKNNGDKKLGIVWIDAHGDLHSPYTSPTGNMHGMPLALVLGCEKEELKKNKPSEKTIKLWNDMRSHFQKPNPKTVFIALRDTEPQEDTLIEQEQLPVFTVDDLKNKGIKQNVLKIKEYLADCDEVYVSFDVDSMDSETVSDGTGTPVPNGLSLEQAKTLVTDLFAEIPQIKYFEITEINPLLDSNRNSMAEAAYEVLEIALGCLDKKSVQKKFATV